MSAATLTILLGLSAPGQDGAALAQPGSAPVADVGQLTAATKPNAFDNGFTFAAAGDLIGPWQPDLQGNADLERVAEVIQKADVGFANLEGSVFDLSTFKGFQAAENGGGRSLLFPAAVAAEYKALGLNMLSRANDHAMDWGIEGLLDTSRALDVAGIVHAGSGLTAVTAREPAYLKSPKGTIALVSVASTYPAMAAAGDIGGPSGGSGGIFALRSQRILSVTKAEMDVMWQIGARQNWEGDLVNDPQQILIGGLEGPSPSLGGMVFRLSDKPGQTWELNQNDHQAILTVVAEAKKAADFVVFSIHAHEQQADGSPADFLQPLFHEVIDAGADVVVRHGAHVLGGIELYKGKPIFYDMGSLFSPLGAKTRSEQDNFPGTDSSQWIFDVPGDWNDTAVAVSEFRDGKISEIRIHPMTLNIEGPTVGQPRLATPGAARRILQKFQRDSMVFGTQIHIEKDLGIILPSAGR